MSALKRAVPFLILGGVAAMVGGGVFAYNRAEAKQKEQRDQRSEEHTSELQSQFHLVCRLLLEKKNIPRLMMHLRVVGDSCFVSVRTYLYERLSLWDFRGHFLRYF